MKTYAPWKTNPRLTRTKKTLYGPWLRSTEVGRNITEPGMRQHINNIMNSPSFGQYSPIPKGLLKKIGKLTLDEDYQANKKPEMANTSAENRSNEDMVEEQ